MIFLLFEWLRDRFPGVPGIHVLRYTSTRLIAAAAAALLVCLLLGPAFIRWLHARQLGEVVRDRFGPDHAHKGGTPTMGGTLILAALGGSTLLFCDLTNGFVRLALAVTASLGVLGFCDDWLKLRGAGPRRGLSGRVKLACQFAIAGAAVGVLLFGDLWPDPLRLRLGLPLADFDSSTLALPAPVYLVFGLLVIVGSSNAVNLTDGLDGLAIGPVIIAAFTFSLLCYASGTVLAGFNVARYLGVPYLDGVGELAVFCAAMGAAGVGFLWYNAPPASMFMGDVGALPLGGALGFVAIATKNELVWAILGGLFVMEAASVIVQVASFKLLGRRVFAMAPLHHHYEKKGWAESKIVVRAWIVAFMLALVTLGTLKLR